MTTTDPTRTATEPEVVDPDATPGVPAEGGAHPSDEPDAQDPASASRAAAGYRTQLRAVEAERDALTERVEGMQRAQVERLAADRLSVPSDTWDVGRVALADLLDESGDVDPALVTVALDALVKSRPRLAAGTPGASPWGDDVEGGAPSGTSGGASWGGFLSGRGA